METYFMFGKYTHEAIKEISINRTQKAVDEIKKLGGEVNAMHALLGEFDLLFCVNLPDNEAAMKASAAITRITGISFHTCPAITVETFDRVMANK